jgi:hypothetical protein
MQRGGRYAGRLRLEIAPNRGEKALCGFVEAAVAPGALVVTDAAPAYASLGKRGYAHLPVVEGGNPDVAEEYLPIVHLVFSNLKAWLQGTHHGRVEPSHGQGRGRRTMKTAIFLIYQLVAGSHHYPPIILQVGSHHICERLADTLTTSFTKPGIKLRWTCIEVSE